MKQKEEMIKKSAENYKKLPKDKQMFVLGYMEGVLSTRQEKTKEVAGVQ